MISKFFSILILSLTFYSTRANEACIHLYKAADLIGCNQEPLAKVNSLTMTVCKNSYTIQANDTCVLIAEKLALNEELIKGFLNCNGLEIGQVLCTNFEEAKHELFSLTDLDILISGNSSVPTTEAELAESVIPQFLENVTDNSIDFADGLKQHNFFRSLHKVPELVYNETIALEAQKWAEHLAKLGKLIHNYEIPYGENLAQGCGFIDFNVTMATGKWYDEIKNYNFTTGFKISKEGGDIGHFTQVVWKKTSQVGFGKALDEKGCVYIVANYYPPGNLKGRYVKNVLDVE